MPKIREHHDPVARLDRLKKLIEKEPRVEGRLDRKWATVEQEIAEIEAKNAAKAKASAKK